jgi:hypothetical protein
MPSAVASLIFPYVKIWSDEALECLAGATTWGDMRCPATSAGPGPTNPSYQKFMDNGAGSVGVWQPRFDDPGAEDDLMFDIQMAHRYKLGSTIYPHIHWSPDDANAGNVGWGLEYTEANIDEVFPSTQITILPFSTTSTAKKHIISSWAGISKPTRGISCMFKARVFRSNSGGIDTYAGYAWLHEFDIHYEKDTLGSRTEFVK